MSRWKKTPNVCQTKLLYIPVNQGQHWSMCVVVNPFAMTRQSEGPTHQAGLSPYVLFLDSFPGAHDYNSIFSTVRPWLLYEWNRAINNPPFLLSRNNVKLLTPEGTHRSFYM